MSFGKTFYFAKDKYGIGSAQPFYFGFYKNDRCIIFPFSEKKRRERKF